MSRIILALLALVVAGCAQGPAVQNARGNLVVAGVELSSADRLSVMFARAGTNAGAAAGCGVDIVAMDQEILELARVIKDAGVSARHGDLAAHYLRSREDIGAVRRGIVCSANEQAHAVTVQNRMLNALQSAEFKDWFGRNILGASS